MHLSQLEHFVCTRFNFYFKSVNFMFTGIMPFGNPPNELHIWLSDTSEGKQRPFVNFRETDTHAVSKSDYSKLCFS